MLEQPDQRGEDEAQENRQRDRHENLATKIQRRDNDAGQDRGCHRAEERHQFVRGAGFEWLLDHDLALSGYWSMAHEGQSHFGRPAAGRKLPSRHHP